MPRNGSGTYSPAIDFTDEAASPPIEIAKLDTQMDDLATALTNSVAADGQTNPSANLPMNGFKHTDVGAATALNQYARASELIDQDHVYYVDSGSANTYVITPSPAISAYEEGQRFVFRATNANSGASTLNVNNLGAIAIETNDGSALVSGMIAVGGYYEVTYDANSTPDRFVLTSVPSSIDGLLSSNVPLKDDMGTITDGDVSFAEGTGASIRLKTDSAGFAIIRPNENNAADLLFNVSAGSWQFDTGLLIAGSLDLNGNIDADGTDCDLTFTNIDLNGIVEVDGVTLSGAPTFDHTTASGVGKLGAPSRDVAGAAGSATLATDSGGTIRLTGGTGETFTLDADPPEDAVIVIDNASGNSWTIAASGTLIWASTGGTGNRTLPDDGRASALHRGSGVWVIDGAIS